MAALAATARRIELIGYIIYSDRVSHRRRFITHKQTTGREVRGQTDYQGVPT
jgi:hypothetical protein